MSVLRSENWLGQQRVDVQHLRGIDSGVTADFDLLAGTMLTNRVPFVLQGFNLVTALAGTAATSLQISVAGGVILHPTATEVGTIFSVAVGRTVETLNATNTRVIGGFTASTVNYVGVDLRRSADSTTADLVEFLDANLLVESPSTVPLGRTLDYVIVVGTQDFSTTPTVAPLCKVTTDANNNVVTLEDARNMFGRLGKGGSVTNPTYAYSWPGGRTEVGNNSDFSAADKAIPSLKDWMDAAMTRIWEIGGGEHWYSSTSDHNVHMVRNGVTLFSNGDYFEWTGTNLHWRELRFVFPNSTGSFNDVADQLTDAAGAYGTTATNLADGDCIYVDLDRSSNRTGGTALAALKGVTLTVGSPTVPGSRFIIAWRIGSNIYTRNSGYAVGTTFNPATTSAIGMVKLSVTPGAPGAPVVFNPDVNGGLTVAATGGNATGTSSTGNGSGAGINAQGGASGGNGVVGIGGAGGGGIGGSFQGGAAGAGIVAVGGNNSSPGGQFTGGAVGGTGILATGTGSGVGIDATGGTSGSAVVAHGVASNDKPTILAKDQNSNNRFLVDHLGFPMGVERWEMREIWCQPAVNVSSGNNVIVPNNPRWLYKLGAAAQLLGLSDNAYPGPRMTFSLASGVSNYGYLYTAMPIVNMGHNSASMLAVAEVQIRFSNIQDPNTTHYVGFSDQVDPRTVTAGTGVGMWFEFNNGTVTGKAYLVSATPFATVALGAYTEGGTVYTLKIELNRAASTIRFAINGTYSTALSGIDFSIGWGSPMYFHASTYKNVADARTGIVDVGGVLVGWGEATF